MNTGNYVRTKDYGFIKVKSFYYNEDMIHILDENCNEYDFSKELVDDFKSSPNIIDLIEVGDIVKIEYQGWHQVSTKFETLKFFDDEGTEYLYDEIRAVITREQLESMEYKVGDE